jgi:hypothetical protein
MAHSDMVKSNVKVVWHEKVNGKQACDACIEASIRAGSTCSCSLLLLPSLALSEYSFAPAEYGLRTWQLKVESYHWKRQGRERATSRTDMPVHSACYRRRKPHCKLSETFPRA